MWSYLPLLISATKSWVVWTSGTIAFLNFPILASNAFLPSKKTTSSPLSATSWSTAFGFRCLPPLVTPRSVTVIASGALKATSSSLTRTLSFGKSLPVPIDHLKSIFLKPVYCLVVFTYFFRADMSPPRVPLMPCLEIRMRPFRPRLSHRFCCHSLTASGSEIGAKP